MAEASTSTSHKSTFFVGESISVCVGVKYFISNTCTILHLYYWWIVRLHFLFFIKLIKWKHCGSWTKDNILCADKVLIIIFMWHKPFTRAVLQTKHINLWRTPPVLVPQLDNVFFHRFPEISDFMKFFWSVPEFLYLFRRLRLFILTAPKAKHFILKNPFVHQISTNTSNRQSIDDMKTSKQNDNNQCKGIKQNHKPWLSWWEWHIWQHLCWGLSFFSTWLAFICQPLPSCKSLLCDVGPYDVE